jgi:hypothetical protein
MIDIKILRVIGIILMADGFFSMILVEDKRFLWQVARFIRLIFGFIILGFGMM